MWLLTITVCLTAPGDAECSKALRYVENKAECIAIAGAYREYFDALKADYQGEMFTTARCARGKDT